jgi:translation initiation factor eIF-2B subunit beta
MNAHALDHIHNGDHILTIGKSRTVEEFLLAAARKRQFSVTVSETAPLYEGHYLAQNLVSESSILKGSSNNAGNTPLDITIIPESCIASVMSKVSKIIIGCHAVLANGGLICISGTNLMLTCAAQYQVPVVVVTGIYKLYPLFPSDLQAFCCPNMPSGLMDYDSECLDQLSLYSPYYDYVDPSLVSLFITNVGGHPPSYLYRLLGELYDRSDDNMEDDSRSIAS